MEESLLARGMIFKGEALRNNEELSPVAESQVVIDWLFAVGGNPLVETVFSYYSQDLEKQSLKDIKERISFNMDSLMTQAEKESEDKLMMKSIERINF